MAEIPPQPKGLEELQKERLAQLHVEIAAVEKEIERAAKESNRQIGETKISELINKKALLDMERIELERKIQESKD